MKLKLVDIPKDVDTTNLVRRLPIQNRLKNYTGKKFGPYKVIGFAGFKIQKDAERAAWLLQCHCGKYLIFNQHTIPNIYIKKCCHGHHSSQHLNIYKVWSKIRFYGSTYKPWRSSFIEFKEYIYSLERPDLNTRYRLIDELKGYQPGNIIWAKKNAKLYTYNGETYTIAGWARKFNISQQAMWRRIKDCEQNNLPLDIALTSAKK